MTVSTFGLDQPPETASFAPIAEELGKTPDYVRRQARKLLPEQYWVRVGKVQKLRFEHRDEAVQILRDSLAAKADSAAVGFSYSSERARREHYEAERSRLNLLERQGELLDRREVQRAYVDAVKRTSSRLLQIPRQLAAVLSGADPREAETLLETAIRDALRESKAEVQGIELAPDILPPQELH